MTKYHEVDEELRRIISIHGAEIKLTNVRKVSNTGNWLRLHSEEGYVLVNPNNVLAMIIKGKEVF